MTIDGDPKKVEQVAEKPRNRRAQMHKERAAFGKTGDMRHQVEAFRGIEIDCFTGNLEPAHELETSRPFSNEVLPTF